MGTLKLIESAQIAFDYGAVPAPVAVEAREAAQRIRLRLRRSAEDIIEIGRDLLAVKAALPHGSFLPWIEAEFGMSVRASQRFMQVAEGYAGKYATVAHLEPSALYALASAEPEVQARIEEMIAAGEVVRKADVEALRREADAAKLGQTLAAQDADASEARVAELQKADSEARAIELEAISKRIRAEFEAEQTRLAAEAARKDGEIAELKRQLAEGSVGAGNVVALHKPLSAAEKAAIDAETDQLADGNFNKEASAHDRSLAVRGSLRAIHAANITPSDLYSLMTKGQSKKGKADDLRLLDDVRALLNNVKEMFND